MRPDTPPHSLKDPNANSRLKTMEEGVRVCSLSHNTSRVKKTCWSSGMRTGMSDQRVNYSHGLAQTKQQVG